MTENEFQFQTGRLVNHFGERFFTEEFNRLLFRRMGNLPASRYERIVDRMISEMKLPPRMPDFEAAQRALSGNDIGGPSAKPFCGECDRGFIYASETGSILGSRTFACTCNTDNHCVPFWTAEAAQKLKRI